MKQAERKRTIDVDKSMVSVSSVTFWYRNGYFGSEEEALGAFKLAYQQGMDGMGESVEKWMGLDQDEYQAWMENNKLPEK